MILMALIALVLFIIFFSVNNINRYKKRKNTRASVPFATVFSDSLTSCALWTLISVFPCLIIGLYAETAKTTKVETRIIATNNMNQPIITGIKDGKTNKKFSIDIAFEDSYGVESVENVSINDIYFENIETPYLVEYKAVYKNKLIDFFFLSNPPNEYILHLPKDSYNASWFISTDK